MDCTNRRVLCPQGAQRFQLSQGGLIREDEDCLHLNVYVPVVCFRSGGGGETVGGCSCCW